MRVPTPDVSVVDLVARTEKPVTKESVNAALKKASEAGDLKGYLEFVEAPLVSTDFIGSTYSSSVDAALTMTMGDNMVKVISWNDNEMGYSTRLAETVEFIAKKL